MKLRVIYNNSESVFNLLVGTGIQKAVSRRMVEVTLNSIQRELLKPSIVGQDGKRKLFETVESVTLVEDK